MIRLFRKVRKQLLSDDKYSIYILYAVGEIMLVMVGILLGPSKEMKDRFVPAKSY